MKQCNLKTQDASFNRRCTIGLESWNLGDLGHFEHIELLLNHLQTLQEGLTVYRDQEFSADMGSRARKRIEDVRILRAAQFPEDNGPMSHPIRPEKYAAIDNFYTATVYNKGAEVIRMYETLMGRDGFRKGMDLYFDRHDGSAVTCDDFRSAMQAPGPGKCKC